MRSLTSIREKRAVTLLTRGFASEVMTACDRGVEESDDAIDAYDSHGIARALAGDATSAVAEFQAAVDWSKKHGVYKPFGTSRETFIAQLQKGANPFDAATLAKLRYS